MVSTTINIQRKALTYAINENMNTITNSFTAQELIDLYNEQEKVEDKLKKYILEEYERTGNTIFQKIYNELIQIDKLQDMFIAEIHLLMKRIALENRRSNGKLSFYDNKGLYQKAMVKRGLREFSKYKKYRNRQMRLEDNNG